MNSHFELWSAACSRNCNMSSRLRQAVRNSRFVFPAIILPALLLFFVQSIDRRPANAFSRFPKTTLWAWERPEDLRSLDPTRFAVAYLEKTISITDTIRVVRRKQPLLVTSQTRLIAVVRIEAPAGTSDLAEPALASQVAAILAEAPLAGRAAAVQVDFDARESQRNFYRKVLLSLRQRLPNTPISITALASWCAYDDWIADLPIDEAVPMFFRMGPDHFASEVPGWSYPVRAPVCRGSVGVSTDEAWPRLPARPRLYVFHPRPWNVVALQNLEPLLKYEPQIR